MKQHLPLLLLAIAIPLSAQERTLERVDSLMAQGRVRDARVVLDEWQRAGEGAGKVSAGQRARGLYLAARLTENAAEAQEKYLNVALSYPTSREAPEALLRLGQALLAAGDGNRAATYFERVIRDYSKAPARAEAYLWLTRAQLVGGNARAACTTAAAARKADLTTELREQIAVEERRACSPASTANTRAAPTITPAPALPPSVNPTPARSSARFSVQFAAFREPANAGPVAEQLRRAGFDARVAYVEGSPLARVRIGRFESSEQAHAEANRVRAAGFAGIIVDDVQKEKSERQ